MSFLHTNFWRGKSVFLTGHTGFKGGWLSLWLQSLGANVHGYALPPSTNPSLFDAARVADGMCSSVLGNINDFNNLFEAIKASEPEIVIHMAAQPLVRQSYLDPLETYTTNVIGTVHLFEAVRRSGCVKALINVTTDKCYKNMEWEWGYRENDILGGHDPYSSSKACSELITDAYRNSFFNGTQTLVASVRAGNVIGGGDWSRDRLVPDILRSVRNGNPLIIRNHSSIRPWQHVFEPLNGYMMLAERLYCDDGSNYEGPWNFGPYDGDAKTVKWIVEKITSHYELPNSWVLENETQPHEASKLKLDISKSLTKLGWSPMLTLDKAIELAVDWEKEMNKKSNMNSISLSQIKFFMSLLHQN